MQGKSVVNSISLKEGGKISCSRRVCCAATGQLRWLWPSTKRDRPTPTSARPKSVPVHIVCWSIRSASRPRTSFFNPNVFALATGPGEHNNYGVDFIEAVRWIHQNLPGARPRWHLQHVVQLSRQRSCTRGPAHGNSCITRSGAGLTMGIVNAGQIGIC